MFQPFAECGNATVEYPVVSLCMGDGNDFTTFFDLTEA